MPTDPVPLEGFPYDPQKAKAIAAAVDATLEQLRQVDLSAADLLAGLGLVIAHVITRGRTSRRLDLLVRALGDYIAGTVRASGGP